MRNTIIFIVRVNKSFTQIILNTIVPWIKIQSETDNYAHGKSLSWLRVSPAGGLLMINDLQFLNIQIGKCAGAFKLPNSFYPQLAL